MKNPSPLRYPGGKTFLAKEFTRILDAIGLEKPTYVEPYAGGAGAALSLLYSERVERIIINDYDNAIFSFWKSVVGQSESFIKKLKTTPVTIPEWKKQKKIYSDPEASEFELGFATFFLNRTNHSGIMNAFPIGGIGQEGPYKMDARYNKAALEERLKKIAEYKDRIVVSKEEGMKLTQKYLQIPDTFIYLDPPYFKQGAMLYLRHYQDSDHQKLAKVLNKHKDKNWVLTYDERSQIRCFYAKRDRKRLSLNYRVRSSRKARELMIFSETTCV